MPDAPNRAAREAAAEVLREGLARQDERVSAAVNDLACALEWGMPGTEGDQCAELGEAETKAANLRSFIAWLEGQVDG